MFRSNVCACRLIRFKLVFWGHFIVIRVIQAERFDYAQILWVAHYVIGWNLHFVLFEQHPVCPFEERMLFKFSMTFHSKSIFWIQLQQRIDQRFKVLILNSVWECEITCADLIEHLLIVACRERGNSTCHFVKNHSQRPQVCKCTRISSLKHLRCDVEGSSNESVSSFWFLDNLRLFVWGIEWSSIILAIV